MSFVPQERMIDLLQSPSFKEYFRTKIKLPPHLRRAGALPWRVYVQREPDGRWAKKDFATYAEGANFLLRLLKDGAWDGALHCKAASFKPPGRWVNLTKAGKPVYLRDKAGALILRDGKKVRKQKFVPMTIPPGHEWCPNCRRPTVFKWFKKHHAFVQKEAAEFVTVYDPAHLRCTICGIRESGIKWRGGSK